MKFDIDKWDIKGYNVYCWEGSKERKQSFLCLLSSEKKVKVGIDLGEGPPVPIPNTEVKLASAENTCLETGRKDR